MTEESDISDIEYEYYESELLDSTEIINSSNINDPEYVEYTCYKPDEAIILLDNEINNYAQELNISFDEAFHILITIKWNIDQLRNYIKKSKNDTLVKFNLKSKELSLISGNNLCKVCFRNIKLEYMYKLQCGHSFCSDCWIQYFTSILHNGIGSKVECMESNCTVICLRSFIINFLQRSLSLLNRYKKRILIDKVMTHPCYTFCPGTDCDGIIYSKTNKAHKVICKYCNHSFCIKCGTEYHAPSSCDIMIKWRKKCSDDSETANYISAHTKDCPNCHSCIEKSGGCNHMQCAKCKHHFCWMCFKDWKTHGSEYYECSRYKENPAIAQETNHLKARRDLERYLHYYERYDNHNKSLKMEEELRARIVKRIEEKVSKGEGTWIDWQYLHDAATLLTNCRYTLQYTYPFAYYLETGQRQELFEYQQAQLEKEIEELSWKVERAETTDRADLEKQMHIAECKRRTLLQDFL